MQSDQLDLQSRDGKKVTISKSILNFSKFFKQLYEDLDNDQEEVQVDIDSQTLNRIKQFFEHHEYKDIRTVRKPIKTSNFATLATDWDSNFLKELTEEELGDLLLGASYLQCDILQDYCCAFLACQFKDLTIEDVRQKYDIKEEFTPELEQQIKQEYKNIFKDLIPESFCEN